MSLRLISTSTKNPTSELFKTIKCSWPSVEPVSWMLLLLTIFKSKSVKINSKLNNSPRSLPKPPPVSSSTLTTPIILMPFKNPSNPSMTVLRPSKYKRLYQCLYPTVRFRRWKRKWWIRLKSHWMTRRTCWRNKGTCVIKIWKNTRKSLRKTSWNKSRKRPRNCSISTTKCSRKWPSKRKNNSWNDE